MLEICFLCQNFMVLYLKYTEYAKTSLAYFNQNDVKQKTSQHSF